MVVLNECGNAEGAMGWWLCRREGCRYEAGERIKNARLTGKQNHKTKEGTT